MCKSKIGICVRCLDTIVRHDGCGEFDEYKTAREQLDLAVDSDDWTSMHGSKNPDLHTFDIRLMTCPTCKSMKKDKLPSQEIAGTIETTCCALAGTFRVTNTKGKVVIGPYRKTAYQVVETDNGVIN